MDVRKIRTGDERELIDLFSSLDEETEFMLFEPGEREMSEADQAKYIKQLPDLKNVLLLVSESEGVMTGFLGATGEINRRNKHIVKLAMGIKKQFWGQGAGKLLLKNLEQWAETEGYHRIEMTVQESNIRAQKLYQACGYEVEGIKAHALLVAGEYINELYMAKLIGENQNSKTRPTG
ncbi:MAG: GNAT family N-acetyltransferase [Gammaproteobacteria bacterium]|nr:GNAT family N-acetyltransferase [Gammaproteobacteria bacterium]